MASKTAISSITHNTTTKNVYKGCYEAAYDDTDKRKQSMLEGTNNKPLSL